jgi:hypothetical protein
MRAPRGDREEQPLCAPTAQRFGMALVCALAGTILFTVTPTYARDGENKHSLVQHPYSERNLRATVTQLQTEVDALKTQMASTNIALLQSALQSAQTKLLALKTRLTSVEASRATLETRLAGPESKSILSLAPYVTIDTNLINGVNGPHIIFTGANLHIRSGSGTTNDSSGLTGLGNLIIGYNEPAPTGARTGSHNLVGGSMNAFSTSGGWFSEPTMASRERTQPWLEETTTLRAVQLQAYLVEI